MWQLGEIVAQVGKFRDNFLELGKIRRVEKQIDVRKPLAQSIVLIRHHASSQNDRDVGPLALETEQRVELAGNLVLGGLAHDARIKDHNIGGLLVRRSRVAGLLQRRRNLCAVGFVHLAADCPDVEVLAVRR